MTGEELEKRVNNPDWYTSHPSGVHCIDITEHLQSNLSNTVKYLWRCGLKKSETELRELSSAKWYFEREVRLCLITRGDVLDVPTIVRVLAQKVIDADARSTLSRFLQAMLANSETLALQAIEDDIRLLRAIVELG